MTEQELKITEYDDDYSLSKIRILEVKPDGSTHWCFTRLNKDAPPQELYLKKGYLFWYAFIGNQWKIISRKYLRHPYLVGYLQSIESFRDCIKGTRKHYKYLQDAQEYRRSIGRVDSDSWTMWRDIHRKNSFWGKNN